MESESNGGLLYHEVQESKLCAVHCVNTVLQGPFFSEIDLAALASDLDRTERQMMNEQGVLSGDFLMEDSHNVSMGGDFSIQVLEKALGVWDLQVIPFNSPVAEASNFDPERETAFICHLHAHWFSIRKVNNEWYNFNSLYAAPEHLSKFYLSAFLDTLRSSGWSIFVVRGDFPKDCPIPSSNFGQWLTPEDAQRITKSCNESNERSVRRGGDEDELRAQEEDDINAAIAASLLDSIPAGDSSTSVDVTAMDAAIAASLMASAFGTGSSGTEPRVGDDSRNDTPLESNVTEDPKNETDKEGKDQ